MEDVTFRRDRHDIVNDILETARDAKVKTRIMGMAQLSFDQLNKYLDLLVKKGFMENMAIKRKRQVISFYRTTRKGIELLHHMEAVNKLLE